VALQAYDRVCRRFTPAMLRWRASTSRRPVRMTALCSWAGWRAFDDPQAPGILGWLDEQAILASAQLRKQYG
jgi:hypothetical protein